MSTDRSLITWELYPGATNDIDHHAIMNGGWVCETHPALPFPHDDCPGPGMLASEAIQDKAAA